MNLDTALAIVLRQAESARKDHERLTARYPQAAALEQAKALEALRPLLAKRSAREV